MEKGTRVVIVGGRKAKGVTGTVFWTGPDQYSEGLRLGIRGDDGETHWLSAEQVDKLEADADPGLTEAPEIDKGAWVSFSAGGDEVEGEVFWIGENKYGPGQRLGVRDGSGETHWLDAVRVKVINAPEGVGAKAAPVRGDEPRFPSAADEPPPPSAADEPPPPSAADEPPPFEMYDGPPPGYE